MFELIHLLEKIISLIFTLLGVGVLFYILGFAFFKGMKRAGYKHRIEISHSTFYLKDDELHMVKDESKKESF